MAPVEIALIRFTQTIAGNVFNISRRAAGADEYVRSRASN
jgi:hypothetical protein